MTAPVYLLGGARTDFKRNLKKENKTLRDLIVEVVRAALANTGLEATDIQAGIVGNFAGGMFTRQLHVGALLLEADDALAAATDIRLHDNGIAQALGRRHGVFRAMNDARR